MSRSTSCSAAPIDALPAYASLLRCSGPDTVAESCRARARQGYRQIKLHEITLPAVQAARDAVGPDIALMLDTNCPWRVDEALAMVAALRPFDLHWLEEPVWPPEDHAGLAKVRAAGARSRRGENASLADFRRSFELGRSTWRSRASPRSAASARCAASSRWRKSSACASCRIVLISGPASSRACTSRRRCRPTRRWNVSPSIWRRARSATGSMRKTGRMRVPQGPGLGGDPDPALVARYRTHEPNIIR